MTETTKSTNAQLEKLVGFMEENPTFAKNKCQGRNYSATHDELWAHLTISLNALGPPVRTKESWRKIWNGLTYEVHKKLSDEKAYREGTGGGPARSRDLTPLQDRVDQLLNLRDAVYGTPHAERFGHGSILEASASSPCQESPPTPTPMLPNADETQATSAESSENRSNDPIRQDSHVRSRQGQQSAQKARKQPSLVKLYETRMKSMENNQQNFMDSVENFKRDILSVQNKRLEVENQRLTVEKDRLTVEKDILSALNAIIKK